MPLAAMSSFEMGRILLHMPILKAAPLVMAVLLAFHAPASPGAEATEATVPIRIGWQIPAATQGQVLQVLKRTNVLEGHGLRPSFVPFSYGGPQVEAAFAGKLDVFFAGDQPAINLIARGGKWKIVGRLFDDGVGIIVPPNSPIRTVEDLDGKTVVPGLVDNHFHGIGGGPGVDLSQTRSLEEVDRFYRQLVEEREEIPYEADGLVVKVPEFQM